MKTPHEQIGTASRKRERSTITPVSEIKAVPPPVCPLCCRSMHYMGGTRKGEDEAAGRAAAGWRCPDCGELAATAIDLRLYIKRRGPWTEIDADFYPQLHGDAARAAGELVLEGVDASIASGRRGTFLVTLGNSVAQIPSSQAARELMLCTLRERVRDSGSIFTTLCPKAEADRLVAGFHGIAGTTE